MVNKFIAAAEAVSAVVTRCQTTEQATVCLAQLAQGDAVAVTHFPDQLQELIAPLPRVAPEALATTRLTISHAAAGIAATGSLLLDLPDPIERSATALATVHAVVLDAEHIVPDLNALAPRLQELLGSGQSYLSLTTGPSRTADIERVLTIGVHGAKELHIILLEGRL
ncbi:MAG TPA: lactate utilization protein [Desulfuromonas sp.]|nr:lactate utilization protein [Desulfuromonas sp.]